MKSKRLIGILCAIALLAGTCGYLTGNAPDVSVRGFADTFGDINGDGVVNASDAAQILIAAALIGAGGTPALAEEQMDAADVNGDSTVNASDAAVVLIYAAAVGAGQEEVKISDFVH